MFGEERTRTLLGPADPARHSTIAPPRLSAHDLIVRAEAVAEPAAHHRHARPTRRLVLTAGALTAAVGAAAIVQTFGPSTPDTSGIAGPPGADPGVVLVPVAYGAGTRDAGSELRGLAGRLVDAEYDHRTGRYMYHHTKTWGDPVMTSADGRHHVAFADETKVWQAADGTGKQITTQLEPQYPDQESREYWQRNLKPKAPATPAPDDMPLPAEDLAPLPSGRAQLADLLGVRYGAGAVSKKVSTVYGRYVVPRQTRAEILRVLAEVPGFRWRGQVTDRAGRKGVAITYDDREHNAQSLLIFDPNTGELLAHERLTLSPLRISAYQVILGTAWTDRLD
ncbi:CU044_5270 family protein [Micromonospora sp. C28SCA-DRY-2]|uniref:CU044_5270 family protein n=1 Tax=Micromonospora sp. C28SCA-DRY-2 TaxID=3059522 RepID=UPI0026775262|nr:CU044_5270 family protein [Micromonospora sp. C28SCA-DRY-2]MDO3703551.1 CU044_5270 family protein [Micromonospora sp. C28SCA-DRY-2]